jgi:hypothetical protein
VRCISAVSESGTTLLIAPLSFLLMIPRRCDLSHP